MGESLLPRDGAPRFAKLDLTIAHVNDHHSQLDPFVDTELQIDSVATRVELGGFPRVTAAFKAYDKRKDVIRLHAGDAVTGSLYYTLFKGEADAALMNTVCFDAFALGNHEFDDGDAGLKVFLDHLRSGQCQTPVLAANVQPAIGTPLAPKTVNDYLRPFTIKTVKGVKVAIIGIDIKGKTTNSSRPLATTVFEDEVTAGQHTIDALKLRGLRHFVLLTHQGYEADKAMAAQLTDVDAIVGGDSHTLLGDFQPFGLSSSGAYPTVATNKDGKTVCIGQAWEYSKAIGEMKLSFNRHGEVQSCSGKASLLIGSGFKRQDASGAWVAVDETTRTHLVTGLKGSLLRVTEPVATVQRNIENYNTFPVDYLNVAWERPFLYVAGGVFVLLLVPALRRRRWTTAPLALVGWVAVLFILLSGERLGLPETSLVNMNSMYITIFIPLSLFLGIATDQGWRWLRRRHWILQAMGWFVTGAGVTAVFIFGIHQQIVVLNSQTVLAYPADTAGLAWLDENVPPDAKIAASSWLWLGATWAGNDGGAWILPLTGRETTIPPIDHIYNRDYFQEIQEFNRAATDTPDWSDPAVADWLLAQGVTHIYLSLIHI